MSGYCVKAGTHWTTNMKYTVVTMMTLVHNSIAIIVVTTFTFYHFPCELKRVVVYMQQKIKL